MYGNWLNVSACVVQLCKQLYVPEGEHDGDHPA